MENEFVNKYCEGDRVLYNSIMNDKGRVGLLTQNTYDLQDEQWQIFNDSFELYLKTDAKLGVFKGKMFQVWENIHGVSA